MTKFIRYDLTEFGKPLVKNSAELPKPKDNEILLEVIASGVCHSDLHMIEGSFDLGEEGVMKMTDRGMKLPKVLGHESVGKVVEVGNEKDIELIGHNMLIFPWLGCGKCRACGEERTNDCMNMRIVGLVMDGGYASHILVENAEMLVNVDGMEPKYTASHACSGLTVYNALGNMTPDKNNWIAIVGAGGLGLNAVAVAVALGFENIVAVDVKDESLVAAKELGAAVGLNVHPEKIDRQAAIEKLREITGNNLTGVLDTFGGSETARLGVHALIKGGKYIVVGLHGGNFTMPQPWLPQKALTVRGCHVGTIKQLRELIELVKNGKVAQMPVETRRFDQINEALDDLKNGRVKGRIVLTNNA